MVSRWSHSPGFRIASKRKGWGNKNKIPINIKKKKKKRWRWKGQNLRMTRVQPCTRATPYLISSRERGTGPPIPCKKERDRQGQSSPSKSSSSKRTSPLRRPKTEQKRNCKNSIPPYGQRREDGSGNGHSRGGPRVQDHHQIEVRIKMARSRLKKEEACTRRGLGYLSAAKSAKGGRKRKRPRSSIRGKTRLPAARTLHISLEIFTKEKRRESGEEKGQVGL